MTKTSQTVTTKGHSKEQSMRLLANHTLEQLPNLSAILSKYGYAFDSATTYIELGQYVTTLIINTGDRLYRVSKVGEKEDQEHLLASCEYRMIHFIENTLHKDEQNADKPKLST